MGNLADYAKRELDSILSSIDKGKDADGYEMQKVTNDEILELVKVFEGHGDSGFSANYKIGILTRLLKFKPVTTLKGTDDEWVECYDGCEQNRRCSSVFRDNKDNSKARDINMYIYSDNGGISWWSGSKKLEEIGYSSLISFPYLPLEKPKKVYIRYRDIKKHDEFDDITGDEKAIAELREDYKKHPDDWRW